MTDEHTESGDANSDRDGVLRLIAGMAVESDELAERMWIDIFKTLHDVTKQAKKSFRNGQYAQAWLHVLQMDLCIDLLGAVARGSAIREEQPPPSWEVGTQMMRDLMTTLINHSEERDEGA